jgi:hypothetical protein
MDEMYAIRNVVKNPVLPLGLILASVAAWMVFGTGSDAHHGTRPAGKVFFVSPLEETSGDTIPDWAAEADVVVRAAVTGEKVLQPPTSVSANKDGLDLVGRSVSLNVTNVIWRSADETRADPTSFTMDAFGWMQADDGSKREVAVEGAPRLETGHEYVLALVWREAECSPGDATVPAHWSVLGSGAALPADNNTIGVGEFEGSKVDLTDDPADSSIPEDSALDELVGEKPAAIESALDQADDSSTATPEAATACK